MMTKILIVFLFISQFYISYPATDELNTNDKNDVQTTETTKDEINIKELVDKQIEISKQKQFDRIMAASLHEIIEVESKENKSVNLSSVDNAFQFSLADLSAVLFITAVVAMILFIVNNRIKNLRSKVKDDPPISGLELLKKNISMLRNEDPLLNREDAQLSSTRKNLKNASLADFNLISISRSGDKIEKQLIEQKQNILNDNISTTAKEFQLSKGEILLASKIKSIEQQKTLADLKRVNRKNRLVEV